VRPQLQVLQQVVEKMVVIAKTMTAPRLHRKRTVGGIQLLKISSTTVSPVRLRRAGAESSSKLVRSRADCTSWLAAQAPPPADSPLPSARCQKIKPRKARYG